MIIDGILVVDKPVGPTSHDVVAEVRRALKQKKVGHTGTLDPVATGVLPLVLGSATKIAKYLTGGNKTYRATFRLGVTTSTLDSEGEITEQRPVDVSESRAHEVLASFLGPIQQIPPMFSAKKLHGKRLYELARRGLEVEREPKSVTIHSLRLLEYSPPDLAVEVTCSAGTYVRVLAEDTGKRLGCGAHLKNLRRLAAGPFGLADALSLAYLIASPEQAAKHVLPISRALADIPKISVPLHIARRTAAGHQLSVAELRTLDVPEFQENQLLALWTDAGELLALVRAELPSSDLDSARRERRALSTERVLLNLRE